MERHEILEAMRFSYRRAMPKIRWRNNAVMSCSISSGRRRSAKQVANRSNSRSDNGEFFGCKWRRAEMVDYHRRVKRSRNMRSILVLRDRNWK